MSDAQAMPAYVPILILGVVALGFGVFTLVLSHVFGRPRPDPGKVSTYECGMPPIGNARERFPIKFYLVCMIFILFDIDAAFLYPWALVFKEFVADGSGLYALGVMGVFIAVVAVADIYAWKVGALDW